MFHKELLTSLITSSLIVMISYVPISRDRGQTREFITLDNLGLTLRGMREKIRTILIYNYKDE